MGPEFEGFDDEDNDDDGEEEEEEEEEEENKFENPQDASPLAPFTSAVISSVDGSTVPIEREAARESTQSVWSSVCNLGES